MIKLKQEKSKDLKQDNNNKDKLKSLSKKWNNYKNNKKEKFSRKNNSNLKLTNKLFKVIKMQCWLFNKENKNKEMKSKK